MNFVEDFVGRVLEVVTGQRERGWNLIAMRKPTEKLSQGDFSFPTDLRIWGQCLLDRDNGNGSGDVFSYRGIDPEEIVRRSQGEKWDLPVERVEVQKNRCIVFLDRRTAFKNVIIRTLKRDEEDCEGIEEKSVFVEEISEDNQTLTDFRGILLRKVLLNLLARSRKYSRAPQRTDADISCTITSKSSAEVASGSKKIIPGVVLDSRTRKKSSSATWMEILEAKVKECELVARHRYGFRGPGGDSQAGKMFENLGKAILTLELVEAKPTSPVAFGGSSSRSGSFILYNSARMETLLEAFRTRNFPETPDFSEIDFSLLSEPEEWIILLNFVASEQWMIEKSLCELPLGRISPHLVCSFLQSLVTIFSTYYRRVQILTDNRQHLLQVLHCRIVLLRALRKVFNRTLALLDIAPVAKM
ncbi:DALR anticodon-binding domain-containing protein 3 [Phlebotomus papatasi]|uniref:DALR anticodon-binding domain-containing protein 3 n=1 Tax=Phlebotomus papatasi TaxID=29031 RepID=UPI002483E482|nr:DALR anticodon-binding domain-containing protein 3 [Phlebotomus papatasi]